MSKLYSIKEETLTTMANSIRSITGETGEMSAADMNIALANAIEDGGSIVSAHNIDTAAHPDIREEISQLSSEIADLITALPYGGSKEWLQKNGDITQHYQIDGYVWSYIDSTGWTKGAKQFIVVSNTNAMTNAGGTAYLLRSGNNGTVYAYQKASGDSETPVYPSLPETANDGDVVAVGNRKYRATVTTGETAAYTNIYDPATMAVDTYLNKRINSSHGYTAQNGMFATPYIPVSLSSGQILTVRTKNIKKQTGSGNDTQSRILMYTKEGTYSTGVKVQAPSSSTAGWTITEEADGVVAYTTTMGGAASLIRISLNHINNTALTAADMANAIITVNEEIKTTVSTVVEWVDIGEYVAPVEAKWYATSETYTVVDALGTATNGDVVVYSVDGWEYSYLDGKDWMATSKYTDPYLLVDGTEVDDVLSDTSENPVQNKVVKEALDRNAEEIYVIRNEIANIETGGDVEVSIPSYWESSVDEAINKVKAIQDAGGKDVFHFIHFSDMHYMSGRTNYTDNIGLISKKLMDKLNIPFVVGTGDITESGTAASSDAIDADVADAFATFNVVGLENLIYCKGNHDGAWGPSATYGVNYAMIQHPNKLWNRLYRWQAEDFRRVFSDDGSYYFVDNIPQKVRYIVLNSHWADYSSISDLDYNAQSTEYNTQKNINYGDAQAEWLATKALDFDGEDGWTVVVFTHAPLWNRFNGVTKSYMAVQYAGTNNASTIRSILMGFYNKSASVTYKSGSAVDFSNVGINCTVAGVFCGHCHTDIMCKLDEAGNGTYLPFPIVSITSAGNNNSSYEEGFGMSVTTRTLNSDTETAFDIVSINKATKTIYTTRVGAGSDRFTSYDGYSEKQ